MSPDAAFDFTESAPGILVVRFNRPTDRNPLSISTLTSLRPALSEFLESSSLKSIIFTGTEDVFASGANINELARLDSVTAHQFAELGQSLMRIIAGARQKTIAAINGYCFGGGLDLALACDIRIASASAKFAHPGARLGIITGWGGTQRLPRLIGAPRAFELLATAKVIDADAALRIGLVDRIADPVTDAALQVAQAA